MGRSWEYESVYFCLSSVWSMNLRAFKNFVFVYFKCFGVIVLYSRLINPEFSIYGCQVYWKIICVYSTRINYIYITCVCINYILIICIINCCRIKQLVQSQYELGASGFFFLRKLKVIYLKTFLAFHINLPYIFTPNENKIKFYYNVYMNTKALNFLGSKSAYIWSELYIR